ncbi:ATP-binding protein [Streptomyces polyrhachis]|uniref:ATP-binding protein n=1 Tax=Streptomyces polyrhachis TaxID=1282885 RepID=A0ABW2GGI4_9ACTN
MEVTSFVGRTTELAELRALLDQARMVTLVGPGGVGKTRLALRGAAEVAAAGTVTFVELSGVKSSELLPHAVSEALGLPEQSDRPQIDGVVDYLADREMTLVLDTCEHLLDACALFADLLLPHAPGLTILATSRQALDVPGEHVLAVPPLPLPVAGSGGDGGPGAPDGETGGGALELFVARARAAMPGFALDETTRAQALALCRRLDGIPLAIELATVRLRALPLGQLVTQLSDTFALLEGGRMTTLPRHQTLRTTIGWSHELCTPQERMLWARLSVFAGTFDLAAVQSVCTDEQLPAESVLQHLIGLVDKSVVLRAGENSARYRLLDTIREFGAETLAAQGGREQARRRHVTHYRERLRECEEGGFTSRQTALYRAMLDDADNLRVALQYASQCGELVSLTGDMWLFWLCGGRPAEATRWMDRALSLEPGRTAERARTLAWYATFAVYQGDHASASRAADEALEIAEELGDEGLLARALLGRGAALAYAGEDEEGREVLEESRRRMIAVGDSNGLALVTTRICITAAFAGRPQDCLEAFDKTVELLGEDTEECFLMGFVYMSRGMAHLTRGEIAEAGQALRRAVALKDSLDEILGIANTLAMLGWVAVSEGRHRRAAWLLGASDTLAALVGKRRLLGNPRMIAMHGKFSDEARGELGEERYGQLHRQGGALPRSQATAFAVRDLDTLPEKGAAVAAQRGSGPGALTRREREVAELVAQGLSNREVAERLVISKRTADAHVEHILAKLGFSSRSEIAALLGADAAVVRTGDQAR